MMMLRRGGERKAATMALQVIAESIRASKGRGGRPPASDLVTTVLQRSKSEAFASNAKDQKSGSTVQQKSLVAAQDQKKNGEGMSAAAATEVVQSREKKSKKGGSLSWESSNKENVVPQPQPNSKAIVADLKPHMKKQRVEMSDRLEVGEATYKTDHVSGSLSTQPLAGVDRLDKQAKTGGGGGPRRRKNQGKDLEFLNELQLLQSGGKISNEQNAAVADEKTHFKSCVSPITAAAPQATTLIMPELEVAEHTHPVLRQYQETSETHLKEAAHRDNQSQSSTAKYEVIEKEKDEDKVESLLRGERKQQKDIAVGKKYMIPQKDDQGEQLIINNQQYMSSSSQSQKKLMAPSLAEQGQLQGKSWQGETESEIKCALLGEEGDEAEEDEDESSFQMTQNSAQVPGGSQYQGRWTEEEHEKFLEGLKLFGKDWRRIEEFIGSRTCAQIRSHAQKYFNRLQRDIARGIKRKDEAQVTMVLGKKKKRDISSGEVGLQKMIKRDTTNTLISDKVGLSQAGNTASSKPPLQLQTNEQLEQISQTLLNLSQDDDLTLQLKQLIASREQLSIDVLVQRMSREAAGEIFVQLTNKFHELAMRALQQCKFELCNRLIDERNLTQFVCILLSSQVTIGAAAPSENVSLNGLGGGRPAGAISSCGNEILQRVTIEGLTQEDRKEAPLATEKGLLSTPQR